MTLKVKRINENFVTKMYPELIRAVGKIDDLTEKQREMIYGLCVDIAEKSEGDVDVFFTDFGDNIEVDLEDEL